MKESSVRETPEGVDARLLTDATLTEHERRHAVTRELIATRFGVASPAIRLKREEPGAFGHRTHLTAHVEGDELPLTIKAATFASTTVVAIADLHVPLGVDIRPREVTEAQVQEMRRHSRLFADADPREVLEHWTRVQAIREADGRGSRLLPESVLLDLESLTGWAPDRRTHYRLADLSNDTWTVTLAYGAGPL
jgi:hypothetical protein